MYELPNAADSDLMAARLQGGLSHVDSSAYLVNYILFRLDLIVPIGNINVDLVLSPIECLMSWKIFLLHLNKRVTVTYTDFAEYDLENPRIITKCKHHFHLSCIYEWMERSDTCPICEEVCKAKNRLCYICVHCVQFRLNIYLFIFFVYLI